MNPQIDNCVFCEIAGGRISVEGLKCHGSTTISFIPLNPVTPGHRLFVPFEHGSDVADRPAHAAMALFWAGRWGAEKNEDFNIITSRGEYATQTVFHTHIHYVPRRKGDGLLLPWSNQEKQAPLKVKRAPKVAHGGL